MVEDRFKRSCFDAQLVARALKDRSFRDRLVQDPRGVYEEELRVAMPGHAIPEGVEIRIAQEKEDAFYVVLPYLPPEMNLSDDVIARVSRHEQTHRNPCWGLGDAPE